MSAPSKLDEEVTRKRRSLFVLEQQVKRYKQELKVAERKARDAKRAQEEANLPPLIVGSTFTAEIGAPGTTREMIEAGTAKWGKLITPVRIKDNQWKWFRVPLDGTYILQQMEGGCCDAEWTYYHNIRIQCSEPLRVEVVSEEESSSSEDDDDA